MTGGVERWRVSAKEWKPTVGAGFCSYPTITPLYSRRWQQLWWLCVCVFWIGSGGRASADGSLGCAAYNPSIPAYSTSHGVAEQKGGLYENVSFVYGRGWALSFTRPLRVIKWELHDPPWAEIGNVAVNASCCVGQLTRSLQPNSPGLPRLCQSVCVLCVGVCYINKCV